MILILCEAADTSALWAANGLRCRGLRPTVLTDEDLASVHSWRHTIGAHGTSIELKLAGGAVVGDDVSGALNRLTFVPRPWLRRTGGPDSAYAAQEMLAFYLSWLRALKGPTLNPPAPQGLCGNMRHPTAWMDLALRAGLPVLPVRQSSSDDPAAAWQTPPDPSAQTVFVVAGNVLGQPALVREHRRACLRLSEAAHCPILGIDFAPSADGFWGVRTVSVIPDLMRGGDALIDAIAEALAP
jgi:hypothetical protein